MERIETRNKNLVNCNNTRIYNKKNNEFYKQKPTNIQKEIIDEDWVEMYLKPKKSFIEQKKEIREWLKSMK